MVLAFEGKLVHSECVMSDTKIKVDARYNLDRSGFLSKWDNFGIVFVFTVTCSLQMCTISRNTVASFTCIKYKTMNWHGRYVYAFGKNQELLSSRYFWIFVVGLVG